MNKPLEPGDLVEFYSSFETFMSEYEEKNPGLVLSVMEVEKSGIWDARKSAEVMWSDRTVTSEHSSYLRRIDA